MTNEILDYVFVFVAIAGTVACILKVYDYVVFLAWKRRAENNAADDRARLAQWVKFVEMLARAEATLAMAGESMPAEERAVRLEVAEAEATVRNFGPLVGVWTEEKKEEFWAARRRKPWWRRW